MRFRWISRSCWLAFVLGLFRGCRITRKFSVYFRSYSGVSESAGQHETIVAAAAFAQAHPLQPVTIDGFLGAGRSWS